MRLALLPGFALALAAIGLSGFHAPVSYASTGSGPASGHPAFLSIFAQAATTATVTLSASPAVTATPPVTATPAGTSTSTAQSTPVPLPTATSAGSLQINPLDWNFLTSPAGTGSIPVLSALGPFGWIYLALMIALFGVSAYFYFIKRAQWKRTNPVWRRAADRFGSAGMWVSGITILFIIFRVIGLDFFNMRIWLYLCFVALIAVGVWFYYWYSRSYPQEMAKFEKTQRARQYMPGAKKSGAGLRPHRNPATPLPVRARLRAQQ